MRPKKVILLVDGNEQTRSVRAFLLETRGYRVLQESTPADVLGKLPHVPVQCGPNSLDLIISDLLLPAMDGNEFARRVKLLYPELSVLLTSNTVADPNRALHADYFLGKGASSAVELLDKVRVLSARKRGPKRTLPTPQPKLLTAEAA